MRHAFLFLALSFAAFGAHADGFVLTSADVFPNKPIDPRFEFSGFGCSGKNQSPQLSWSGAPREAKSFAVTVYDPDAPTGSGWWHWLVLNIPASTSSLPPDAGAQGNLKLPAGAVQVRNDYGVPAWGGICPPPGARPHRYVFTVHALKTPAIELPDGATAALAGFMINANTIAKAAFTATNGRPATK